MFYTGIVAGATETSSVSAVALPSVRWQALPRIGAWFADGFVVPDYL